MEGLIDQRYTHKYPGGFLKYIDTLQAYLNELDTLLPGQYLDNQKRRILFRNLKNVRTLKHLIQACKDRDLSYQEAAIYLRVHGADIDEEDQEPRKVQQVARNEESYLTYEEAREVYCTMADESGPRKAFKVLREYPALRESLRIHPKIWKRLSEAIQSEIRTIRDQIETSDSTENKSNSKPTTTAKSLPPQYGLNRSIKTAQKEVDDADRLTAVLQSYTIDDNETMSDDDSSSYDDIRLGAMVQTDTEPLQVQANLEYEKRFVHLAHTPRVSYAICDSGADSCVVGKLAKVESVTMRTANLVG
ncbi:MAG TPA: hypothetical protein V6D48_21985, partial [Oculatellaceae cyanobacterium]